MKKLFILTGESSGDKLASKVISDLKKINQNIEFLSVGGEHLQSLGIKSIYDLKEITYLGFTNVNNEGASLFDEYVYLSLMNVRISQIAVINAQVHKKKRARS